MAQAFYTTVPLLAASAVAINVQVGFVPALIQLINLSQMASPTNTNGWKSVWQQGMAAASSLNTVYTATAELTSYNSSSGITLLNPLGSEVGQYGAVISGITNANPGVVTVDSTAAAGITAGCVVRVSNVASDLAGPALNANYYVASVTATSVTFGTPPTGFDSSYSISPPGVIASKSTSASGVYVSGGYLTVIQNANATSPFPLNTVYSDIPQWYNESIQGFILGTACFANATYSVSAPDQILVACFDSMQP